MNCLIILSAVIVSVSCQWNNNPGYGVAPGYSGDPSLARILSDQRAHHVAGDFRLSVKQEDGTNIEELATSADGTRRGQYSYVNNLGQTESVKWEAGPGGFRILNANNQPAHTQHTAAWQAAANNLAREHEAARARVAEANRLAALRPKPVEEPTSAPRRAPAPAPVQQYRPAPAPVQPRPAPQQISYTHPAAQPQYAPVPQSIQQYTPTTQAPKRFFPPGQLSFARTNAGYNYDFRS